MTAMWEVAGLTLSAYSVEKVASKISVMVLAYSDLSDRSTIDDLNSGNG